MNQNYSNQDQNSKRNYPNQNYSNPGYPNPDQNYSNQGYPNPNQNYPDQNYPNQNYPNQNYPNQSYSGYPKSSDADWNSYGSYGSGSSYTSKKPKRNDSLYTLIALLLVGVMLGGLILFLQFRKNSEKDSKEDTSQSSSSSVLEISSSENMSLVVEDAYLLPFSAEKYVREEELADWSVDDLQLAVYEIYARYGVTFQDAATQKYFDGCAWYKKGTVDMEKFSDDQLNAFEKENVKTLTMTIRRLTEQAYIFPYSDLKNLQDADFSRKDYKTLQYGLDEIYARHGALMSDTEEQKYFDACSWYQGKRAMNTIKDSELNNYEISNIQLLENTLRQQMMRDMLLQDTDIRLYSASELERLTDDQLRIARNEIYARYGLKFKDASLTSYFSAFAWYQPTVGNDTDCNLNTYEKANVDLVVSVERARAETLAAQKAAAEKAAAEKAAADAAAAAANAGGDYILPGSDRHLITYADLDQLTRKQVWMAKNELYARHGFIFDNQTLNTYFNSKSWYRGTVHVKPEDYIDEDHFNDVELANRDTILAYQSARGWSNDSY